MKKLLRRILIGLLVLIVVVIVAINFIARKSVEVGMKKSTGFPLEIGSLKFGLFTSKIDVRDIKLKNPPGYPEPLFADLLQLYIDYNLPSIISGKNHINEMIIELKELVIIKNAKGETNATKLKEAISSGEGHAKYRIDRLRIKCDGQVLVKDFSRATPTEKRMPLKVSAEYKNISDSTDITRLVLLTVMSQVKLPDIGIKADDLKKGLGTAVKGTSEQLDKAGKGIMDAIKQIGTDKGK